MKAILARTFYLAFLCISLCISIIAEETVTYKNQRGSILTLTWQDSQDKDDEKSTEKRGSLTGLFTSAVGTCATGKPMPVKGTYNGNVIAITVNLLDCRKVIAMTGNLTHNNEQLHTLWLVASQTTDPNGKDWNSNITGADHYKKQG